jgi:hypothetical protein
MDDDDAEEQKPTVLKVKLFNKWMSLIFNLLLKKV